MLKQVYTLKIFFYLLFYVPLKNISLIWRRHHYWWRAAKFRPMLDAQGLWAGRDLYRARPAVTRGLGFSGLIRRTAPFSRLLRHAKGYGESTCILTRILTSFFLSEIDRYRHSNVRLRLRNALYRSVQETNCTVQEPYRTVKKASCNVNKNTYVPHCLRCLWRNVISP
jgi:hypothetical protein